MKGGRGVLKAFRQSYLMAASAHALDLMSIHKVYMKIQF